MPRVTAKEIAKKVRQNEPEPAGPAFPRGGSDRALRPSRIRFDEPKSIQAMKNFAQHLKWKQGFRFRDVLSLVSAQKVR